MRIIAVHLLNDYSGSPKVLMQLLKCWTKNNLKTILYTCGGREGFLSNISGVETHNYWYQFANNKILRLLFLLTSQFVLCIKLLFQLKKSDILYINTVLPFGAGIAGKMVGCNVIYHIHETSIKPILLKNILFFIVKKTANEVIYVSHFLANQENINIKKRVLYNVLENDFQKQAHSNYNPSKTTKNVLMICSLKEYKGVNEFVELSKMNTEYTFKLVVNANQNEIDNYFKNTIVPANLFIYPTQTNTHPFYQDASLILNLSDTNRWVETFGLTILEGMAYGLPAIVPPVGGVIELVENDVNGYCIDSKKTDFISKAIQNLFSNKTLYQEMSKKAYQKSFFFSESNFEKEAISIVQNW
ncbi:glycosyltransferase family 4 protein [Flavobacterium sp.]|uniref:glycosyltransferase family 4 protein n=1 Tax=Flavobacterium sp. TaxID=239 RepID=UPI003D1252C2